MVGGKVIGIARGKESTLLNVQDDRRPGDTCAVRCEERRTDTGDRVEIAVGDSVWWQCGQVLWTPAGTAAAGKRFVGGKARYDVPLPKVGYSH